MSKKTHSGAKKRFKVTASGKVMRRKAGSAHLKSKKNAKRNRRLKRSEKVHKSDEKTVKRLLNK